MYLEHFDLNDFPFRVTPDMDYLFMSPSHARALAYMEYAVINKDGFVVITGEIGAGKTTLIKKLLSDIDESIVVAKLFQTQLDEVELLQSILVEFGINPFNAKKVELLNMLNQFLIDNYNEGKQALLVIDDAQNLNKKALEEITMLSGLETQKEKILHIILAGQPELNDKLDSPDMAQLLQRVRLRYHLRVLNETETRDYVIHRLKIAGSKGKPLFHEEIYELIYEFSGGVPRLINTLCDTALTCTYAEEKEDVGSSEFSGVIDELQWGTYSERNKNYSLLEDGLYDERSMDGDIRNRSSQADPVLYRTLMDITRQLTRIADCLEQKNKFVTDLSDAITEKEKTGRKKKF